MGPTAMIFVREPELETVLITLDKHLRAFSSTLRATRKGRVWDSWTRNGRPIHIEVRQTDRSLWDCEDNLLELALLPEDVPYYVVLSAGCNARVDHEVLRELAAALSTKLRGVATEPTK